MKKKLIGIALILCMLLSFVPMAAFAEEPADGGGLTMETLIENGFA